MSQKTEIVVLEENTELEHGKSYQLILSTSPKATANQLLVVRIALTKNFGIDIYYADFDKYGDMNFRFTPSKERIQTEQFGLTAGALIFALPSILDLVGLVLAGVAIAYIAFTTPTWTVAILFAGVVILVVGAIIRGHGGQLKSVATGIASGAVSAGRYYGSAVGTVGTISKTAGLSAYGASKTYVSRLRRKTGESA